MNGFQIRTNEFPISVDDPKMDEWISDLRNRVAETSLNFQISVDLSDVDGWICRRWMPFRTILWTENNHFSSISFELGTWSRVPSCCYALFSLIQRIDRYMDSQILTRTCEAHTIHLINFTTMLLCLLTCSHLTYNIYFEAKQASGHNTITSPHSPMVTSPLFKG